MDGWQNRLNRRWEEVLAHRGWRALLSPVLALLLVLGLVLALLGWTWGREPGLLAVAAPAEGDRRPGRLVLLTQERILERLTGKPGGYLDNDLFPPGSLADNMPAWERGVLVQSRDLVAVLRGGGGAPAPEGGAVQADLAEAAEALSVYPGAWSMPSAEGEFARAGAALRRAADRAGDGPVMTEARLLDWLAIAQRRLGGFGARLNASRLVAAAPATGGGDEPGTSWVLVDDVFYEARGGSWALLHLLKAIEVDFAGRLSARGADLGLRAAIHELEAAQQPLWSPVVLNGAGFGPFANHSLVLANYLHRARAELAEVQSLLRPLPLAE